MFMQLNTVLTGNTLFDMFYFKVTGCHKCSVVILCWVKIYMRLKQWQQQNISSGWTTVELTHTAVWLKSNRSLSSAPRIFPSCPYTSCRLPHKSQESKHITNILNANLASNTREGEPKTGNTENAIVSTVSRIDKKKKKIQTQGSFFPTCTLLGWDLKIYISIIHFPHFTDGNLLK